MPGAALGGGDAAEGHKLPVLEQEGSPGVGRGVRLPRTPESSPTFPSLHPVYWLLVRSHWITQDDQESGSRQEAGGGGGGGASLTCPMIRRTKLSQNPQQILSHLRGTWPHQNLHDHPSIWLSFSIQGAQEHGEGHWGQVALLPSCSWVRQAWIEANALLQILSNCETI